MSQPSEYSRASTVEPVNQSNHPFEPVVSDIYARKSCFFCIIMAAHVPVRDIHMTKVACYPTPLVR